MPHGKIVKNIPTGVWNLQQVLKYTNLPMYLTSIVWFPTYNFQIIDLPTLNGQIIVHSKYGFNHNFKRVYNHFFISTIYFYLQKIIIPS